MQTSVLLLARVYRCIFLPFVGNDTFLVVASALQVLHISIDGSTFANLAPPVGLTFYLAVDYDYGYTNHTGTTIHRIMNTFSLCVIRQNYIYFSEFLFTAIIWRVTFNGSSPEIVHSSSSKSIGKLTSYVQVQRSRVLITAYYSGKLVSPSSRKLFSTIHLGMFLANQFNFTH